MKKNEIKIPDGYDLFTDEDIRELALGMSNDKRWIDSINSLTIEQIIEVLEDNGFHFIK
jgi:hypothetical protein